MSDVIRIDIPSGKLMVGDKISIMYRNGRIHGLEITKLSNKMELLDVDDVLVIGDVNGYSIEF